MTKIKDERMTVNDRTNMNALGNMSKIAALKRFLLELIAPLLLAFFLGLISIFHSNKWNAISLNAINGMWNITLLKISFAASISLVSLIALLQLPEKKWHWYQITVNHVRYLSDSIASVTFTTATIIIAVLAALIPFIAFEPHSKITIARAAFAIFLMLVTNTLVYGLSYLTHHPEINSCTIFPVDITRKVLSLLLSALIVLSIWYLFFGEKFCEVSALHQTISECPNQQH